MIGIVLVTHGQLAEEFLYALEHIVGKQTNIKAIGIQAEDDMENRRRDISQAIKNVEDGDGVVLLTDMFGGTPSNLAISLMSEKSVEVVAGVNLPMLIQLVRSRQTHKLKDAALDAADAGRKYISVASKILNDRKNH